MRDTGRETRASCDKQREDDKKRREGKTKQLERNGEANDEASADRNHGKEAMRGDD